MGTQEGPNAFDVALDAAKGRITDPFLLNFLFSMGELSGQVKQLTIEMRDFRKERAIEQAEAEKQIANLQKEVSTLKSRLWLITTIASGVVFALVKLGDWFIK